MIIQIFGKNIESLRLPCGMPDDERLFPIVQEAVQHKMKRQIAKAGVKNIRVHDGRVIIVASQKKPSKIKWLQMILSCYFLQ